MLFNEKLWKPKHDHAKREQKHENKTVRYVLKDKPMNKTTSSKKTRGNQNHPLYFSRLAPIKITQKNATKKTNNARKNAKQVEKLSKKSKVKKLRMSTAVAG